MKAKWPILELYCAANAVFNGSGKFMHKPAGQKARPARVVDEAAFVRLEGAYTDCDIQALLDFVALCDELIPDHIATNPDHAYGKLRDRIRGESA